jgi:hypothetical protein
MTVDKIPPEPNEIKKKTNLGKISYKNVYTFAVRFD